MSAIVEQVVEPQAIAPLSDPQRISTVVKALVRVAEAWSLSNAQAASLFDVPTATWSRMKAGSFKGNLDQDKMMRASLLIGIFKGLRLLFHGPLEKGWPKQPNTGPAFAGQSPVDKMIAGGIPAMMAVRRHIDALRGGV
ncbi:antitoxin Xre-like helix-turn-helix domain-containing protein [uncultured Roseobacter sp.]|uniref:antitoxin Xre-like helix-turn-helix domain-containing protein n=1 Tax=uncultured Roseobacter sp. TaxID=114847 RepID=UPI00263142A5|nr:antitoxin Xre-like helix-turn-helix domain-containing protein [uncultured Roseobacter sp.]